MEIVIIIHRSTLPHTTFEQSQNWVKSMMLSKQNATTEFVICLRDTNQEEPADTLKAIGKAGVWSGSEIGFFLVRAYWGKGIAYEAIRAMTTHAFDELDIQMLTADADPRNDASIELLKKCGFVEDRFEEKTLKVGDLWVDSLYLKLQIDRWVQLQAPMK
jgi:ribosomal-protein-alanine N-acetyltransferase